MVELVLSVLQVAVHQQLAGVLNVRVAVGHGLAVRGGQLAQHPGGQVVLRVGLGADANADAAEILGAQAGDDAFQPVMAARRAVGSDTQVARLLGDVVAQYDDVVGGDLEKAAGAMLWPLRFI